MKLHREHVVDHLEWHPLTEITKMVAMAIPWKIDENKTQSKVGLSLSPCKFRYNTHNVIFNSHKLDLPHTTLTLIVVCVTIVLLPSLSITAAIFLKFYPCNFTHFSRSQKTADRHPVCMAFWLRKSQLYSTNCVSTGSLNSTLHFDAKFNLFRAILLY